MATNITTISGFPVVNPTTPLAFLPPTIADQLEISRYIYVASLGAFLWDILTNINNDYNLLVKYRIRLPTVVYFISRISSLGFIVFAAIFQTGKNVQSCNQLLVLIGWCFSISVSSNSLLFLLRARAVFNGEKLVVGFFAFVWLVTFGGSMTVPYSLLGDHVGPTRYCINSAVKPFATVGIITSASNDALITLAISWRLVTASSLDDSFRGRLKSFFGGEGLPAISRKLLQGGQQYYLITVGGNILTLAMILSPSIPPVYRAMFAIPNIAIENCMACRVFRNIRFGLIPPPTTSLTYQRSGGSTLPIVRPPIAVGRSNRSGDDEYFANTSAVTSSSPIEITKSVERSTVHDAIPMEVMFPVKETDGDSNTLN